MWLDDVVNRMRVATGDYLVQVLYRCIGEYLRQRMYLIGGSKNIVVWDGGFDVTTFPSSTDRSWPFVFVGPDATTIWVSGMLPSCQSQSNRSEVLHLRCFNPVTNKWNDDLTDILPHSAVIDALQVARPPTDNTDRFSVFSFSINNTVPIGAFAQRVFFKHNLHEHLFTERIAMPVGELCSTTAPVYDSHNDMIWVLAWNDSLFGYDIKQQSWRHTYKLPTKSRGTWAHLCMSSCAENLLYVAGGWMDTSTIVDEFNISTNTWNTVNISDIPVHIPTELISPVVSQITKWHHEKSVITVYDGELVYIGHKDTTGGSHPSAAEEIVHRSIVSYNPHTRRRQLRAILPKPYEDFTTLVI
jgi:hypothetical protein